MANRKPLSKKMRFEVFKRDKFTCQYCGRMSPDVILEVYHIKPVAEGGTNDLINLVTSCRDCNRGKGKRKISDNSAVKRKALYQESVPFEDIKTICCTCRTWTEFKERIGEYFTDETDQ